MERQTHAPDDWELHEMSLPPFPAQNPVHRGTDHSEELGAEDNLADQSQRTLPRPPPLPQAHWGHHANRSFRESRQRPGTVSKLTYFTVFS